MSSLVRNVPIVEVLLESGFRETGFERTRIAVDGLLSRSERLQRGAGHSGDDFVDRITEVDL